MHCFTIWQKNNTQEPAVGFLNRRPATNAPIFLQRLLNRGVHYTLDPFQLNTCAIRPLPHRLEVSSEFHAMPTP